MSSGPGFRLARSAVFAAVCVVASALGHAMMSGSSMPVWALGYAFAGVTAGAWWLAGRERGALAVTGATVVTQLSLHVLFMVSQMVHGTGVPATDAATLAGMPGMGSSTLSVSTVAGSQGATHAGMNMGSHEWSMGMLLAHTLAALVCGLWMWRGEAAVYRLGRALAAFLVAPLRRALLVCGTTGAPTAPRTRADVAPATRFRRCWTLRHSVIRRGPPVSPVSS
jgi:hypothetical protein